MSKYCGLVIDDWCWKNEVESFLGLLMCISELKRNDYKERKGNFQYKDWTELENPKKRFRNITLNLNGVV